jgi:ABC-2 type transport system permease protein
VLGDPDNGVIVAAYLGSLFIAGGFLGVGSFTSAITKNQLIAFLVALALCFLLLVAGHPAVTEWLTTWAPRWLIDGVTSLSFLAHFENILKGVLDLRDILYYALVAIFFLLASTVVLEGRKSA